MRVWEFESIKYKKVCQGTLKAHWEVNLSSISDDYLPEENSAEEILNEWARQLGEHDDLVSIYWQVRLEPNGASYRAWGHMPFQHGYDETDFLTDYTWPRDAETGEYLNWLSLPVVDKLWSVKPYRDDKGGFIQSATGWKPSILQPFVSLKSLTHARKK